MSLNQLSACHRVTLWRFNILWHLNAKNKFCTSLEEEEHPMQWVKTTNSYPGVSWGTDWFASQIQGIWRKKDNFHISQQKEIVPWKICICLTVYFEVVRMVLKNTRSSCFEFQDVLVRKTHAEHLVLIPCIKLLIAEKDPDSQAIPSLS